MENLIGASFNHRFLGETIKFTVTRATGEALRLIINDTIQAIWLPKCCFYIDDKGVRVKSIDWKLKRKDFKNKIDLAKISETYLERHGKKIQVKE